MTLDKHYQAASLEAAWQARWAELGVEKHSGTGQPYAIILPPPNVTGSLHMGHAFQDTLMDLLIRWKRMQGSQVHWQLGTDHAGIATQMVVENLWRSEGRDRRTAGREAFVEAIWDWKERSGNRILEQMRRLGVSGDPAQARFTLDPGPSQAVTEAFVQLHEAGLIYRGQRLVNWDVHLHSAVSDLEVTPRETEGFLYRIAYTDHAGQTLSVETTRPETLFGDEAIAVHPDDPRYQAWIGRSVQIPLTDRWIPIIADSAVDPEFGTGCVKITPAHDFFDFQVAQRHGLACRVIMTFSGTLNEAVPAPFQGLDRLEARNLIVDALTRGGALTHTTPHRHAVPYCDRTGMIIEPMLTTQWFVRCQPLAEPALAAVESGEIRVIPESWVNTYREWLTHIQDWCISRQLWWGHRIPAWYDEEDRVYVGLSEEAVRARYDLGSRPLRQDEDVLDTWFSSALWPFSSLGWPESTALLQQHYPSQVLVTGFDILFFWVARMVMMGLYFQRTIPFQTIYVHGLIQDGEGEKMSKSKGNVIDPLDLIDGIDLEALCKKRTQGMMQPQKKAQIIERTRREFPEGLPAFGTDALRFTFCVMANQQRHMRFELSRITTSHHFCNKIWQAARFIQMQIGTQRITPITENHLAEGSLLERALWSEWVGFQNILHQHLEHYRFDWAAQACYEFVWYRFCDYYVEYSKIDPHLLPALITVFDRLMTVLHPMMPFLTEEIAHALSESITLPHSAPCVALRTWPHDTWQDDTALTTLKGLEAVLNAARQLRSEKAIGFSQTLTYYWMGSDSVWSMVEPHLALIERLGNAQFMRIHEAYTEPASFMAQAEWSLWMPWQGVVNLQTEAEQLQKKMDKLREQLTQVDKKLSNEAYCAKAPAEVVAKERAKQQELKETLMQWTEQYQRLLSAL